MSTFLAAERGRQGNERPRGPIPRIQFLWKEGKPSLKRMVVFVKTKQLLEMEFNLIMLSRSTYRSYVLFSFCLGKDGHHIP